MTDEEKLQLEAEQKANKELTDKVKAMETEMATLKTSVESIPDKIGEMLGKKLLGEKPAVAPVALKDSAMTEAELKQLVADTVKTTVGDLGKTVKDAVSESIKDIVPLTRKSEVDGKPNPELTFAKTQDIRYLTDAEFEALPDTEKALIVADRMRDMSKHTEQ